MPAYVTMLPDFRRCWNCGCEGPTEDPAIENLRSRQVKNLIVAGMLSVGVPMFVMGDEVRRSQRGNNNAHCQDNAISWFDWNLLSKHADVLRFLKLVVERRVMRDLDHERRRLSLREFLCQSKHVWHGVKLNQPDWSPSSHSIAISAELKNEGLLLHAILNAYWETLDFELPVLVTGKWRRWIDTTLDPPNEICTCNEAVPLDAPTYRVGARSVVVLISGDGIDGGHTAGQCRFTKS